MYVSMSTCCGTHYELMCTYTWIFLVVVTSSSSIDLSSTSSSMGLSSSSSSSSSTVLSSSSSVFECIVMVALLNLVRPLYP